MMDVMVVRRRPFGNQPSTISRAFVVQLVRNGDVPA